MVSAINTFVSLARGPHVFGALTQLSNRLNHVYLAGRVFCSTISLTGHRCQQELHRLPDKLANLRALLSENDDERLRKLSHLTHISGVNDNLVSELNNLVPHGLHGKWRTYWLECYLKNHVLNETGVQKTSENLKTDGGGGAKYKSPPYFKEAPTLEDRLPTLPHRSDAVIISSCNCGHRQAERADPFDYEEANWQFYSALSKMGCSNLEEIQLAPIFLSGYGHGFRLPAENDYSESNTSGVNNLAIGEKQVTVSTVNVLSRRIGALHVDSSEAITIKNSENLEEPRDNEQIDQLRNEFGFSQPAEPDISMLDSDSVDSSTDSELKPTSLRATGQFIRAHTSDSEEEFDSFSSNSCRSGLHSSKQTSTEDVNAQHNETKQISHHSISDATSSRERWMHNVVFRDGIPTTDWNVGELPLYPSWSVCEQGKYFSYSHSSGFAFPGFWHNSNFLLPWNISMGSSSDRRPHGRGSVKLFVGFQMECPRGHRFFLAGLDKPMSGLMQSSQVRRAVDELLNEDLPLYLPCMCQGTNDSQNSTSARGQQRAPSIWHTVDEGDANTVWAQLTHIYIGIPFRFGRVRFQPRVRPGPAPSTPVFHLGHTLNQWADGSLQVRSNTHNVESDSTSEEEEEEEEEANPLRLKRSEKISSMGEHIKQQPGFVMLENGTIWAMRLPYIYYDGTKVYHRPCTIDEIKQCRLLKGCLSLND